MVFGICCFALNPKYDPIEFNRKSPQNLFRKLAADGDLLRWCMWVEAGVRWANDDFRPLICIAMIHFGLVFSSSFFFNSTKMFLCSVQQRLRLHEQIVSQIKCRYAVTKTFSFISLSPDFLSNFPQSKSTKRAHTPPPSAIDDLIEIHRYICCSFYDAFWAENTNETAQRLCTSRTHRAHFASFIDDILAKERKKYSRGMSCSRL